MKQYYDNDPDDFEVIGGKKVLKDGRTLRVRTQFMDSKSSKAQQVLRDEYQGPQRVTDINGSEWGLHRAGYRVLSRGNIGDRPVRDGAQTDRELTYLEYLDGKDAELRTASGGWWDEAQSPPNSTEKGWRRSSEEQIAENSICTVRNPEYKEFVGSKGRIKNGVCVPLALLGKTDAADAAVEDCYQEYDRAKALEYLDGGRKKQRYNAHGQEEGREVVEENDDDDDEQDSFEEGALSEVANQVSTHTESAMPRDADTLAREHEQRMREVVRPMYQKAWAADARIAQAQHQHQAKMDAVYSAYDQELAGAYRK